MESYSISFTLAKASAVHGGNTDHNNRVFQSANVFPERTMYNVSYRAESIAQAYQTLFGKAVEEYNARQSRPCRRIKDYLVHITEGKREEPYYEIVVQFGDCHSVPFGSERRKTAAEMLHEYMKAFQRRNPNLYVYNAVMHMDEATPHLHIDFIPFYTAKRQRGLSVGVSMRAALTEQGFEPKHGCNQLEQWEASEREKMERILHRYGFEREDKDIHRAHLDVDEYKTLQDTRRMECLLKRVHSVRNADRTAETVSRLQTELNAAQQKIKGLEREKQSPYQSFYYSCDDKLMFMQQELRRRGIPFREMANGLEAQACFVRAVREIEGTYQEPAVSKRAQLRDDTDRILMQSASFEEFLERMKAQGYEIREGTYLAVRPKDSERFIRFKSLGTDYSEDALIRRLRSKLKYEQTLTERVRQAIQNNAPYKIVLMTERFYVIQFAKGLLPMRRRDEQQPFSWRNDAELDRILAFNAALNQGETPDSIRNALTVLEQKEKEAAKAEEKAESLLRTAYRLRDSIGIVFEGKPLENMTRAQAEANIREYGVINQANYHCIANLVESAEKGIREAADKHREIRAALKEKAELLDIGERILNGCFVKDLAAAEVRRRQSDIIPNGYIPGGTFCR